MRAGRHKAGHSPLARAELPVDTVALARFLIGKLLVRELPEGKASGRIVETEAYVIGDAAGHAYRGMTARNRSLFLERGHAYVYLAYGVSWMLNVSSETPGMGAGVLFRALETVEGVAIMARNRGTERLRDLARGPGGSLRRCASIVRSTGSIFARKARFGWRATIRTWRNRQAKNREERQDRHFAGGGPGLAVLSRASPFVSGRSRSMVSSPSCRPAGGPRAADTETQQYCLQIFRIDAITIIGGS